MNTTPLPVDVANFPSTQNVSFNGAAQPVKLFNNQLNPIFTEDVSAAKRPFQVGLCTFVSGDPINPTTCGPTPDGFNVPPDKQLVIEYVSGQCFVVSGEVDAVVLNTIVGPPGGFVQVNHIVPVLSVGAAGLGHVIAQQTRIYADPGSPVSLSSSSISSSFECNVVLSGNLANGVQ
jgi:hypothetical protein